MVELLHDFCSKPVEMYYHNWGSCGYHVTTADDLQGQIYFRQVMNPVLRRFGKAELSERGRNIKSLRRRF
jgi:hypothetical protein